MKRNKVISIILVFILVFAGLNIKDAYGQEINDNVVYLVGSMEKDQIFLESEDIEKSRPVASMSKIMTYYIVKDSIKNGAYSLDTNVIIGEEVFPYTAPGNSRMDLVVGESISVEDLLSGLMVVSGNDAAVALAINDSGTEEAFVEKMNQKAKDLGLENTYFVNSHGLEREDGSSNSMSAHDLYKLAVNVCKDYPEVLEYSKIDVLVQDNRNFVGQATSVEFQQIAGYQGLKTGYTDAAGRCFTGVFDLSKYDSSKDFSIVTVVMNCDSGEERFQSTKELVNFTNNNFNRKEILSTNEYIDIINDNSMIEEEIKIYPAEDLSLILREGDSPKLELEYDLPNGSLVKGEDYGDVIVSLNGETIGVVDLTVNKDFEKANILSRIGRLFSNLFSYMFLMLFG